MSEVKGANFRRIGLMGFEFVLCASVLPNGYWCLQGYNQHPSHMFSEDFLLMLMVEGARYGGRFSMR